MVFLRLLSVSPRDLRGVDFIWFSTSVWEREPHELRQEGSQEPERAGLSVAVSVCLCSALVKCQTRALQETLNFTVCVSPSLQAAIGWGAEEICPGNSKTLGAFERTVVIKLKQ